MRWDAQIDLVDYVRIPGDDGSYSDSEKNVTTVFCNRNTVGHRAVEGRHYAYLKADSAVQLRFQDYSGQKEAVLDGIEYTVEIAMRRGDFVILTLGRMGRNA